MRALIVDDDEPIRSMLATIVRHHGFAVETASDGGQAIESIARDGFDVVLLDLMMPRVDGWAVLRYMQQHRPDLVPHTIVATAVPEREALRSIRSGVQGAPEAVRDRPVDQRREGGGRRGIMHTCR